jgi:hypothetical protein
MLVSTGSLGYMKLLLVPTFFFPLRSPSIQARLLVRILSITKCQTRDAGCQNFGAERFRHSRFPIASPVALFAIPVKGKDTAA